MGKKITKETSKVIILDNIRSSENVGSIFRTADSLGIDKIFLVGFTPSPIDRFGRINQKIAKASLGAEKNISFETVLSINPLLKRLKKDDYRTIAIEQSQGSVDYKKIKSGRKDAFIVGNEVGGIKKSTLKNVDLIAEIPMGGKKESLNVSVALAVALFRITGQ